MQTPRVTNPRRLAIFGGLALLISLALLFSARSVVREVVVLPLSYLFWSIGIFLDTTPQIFFWVTVLILAGLAAYRSLAGRRRVVADILPDLDGAPGTRVLSGQVSHWAVRVNLMRQGQSKYFQNSFQHSVGRLLMDTLSYRYHLTPAQIDEQLREGLLELPKEVRDYALKSMNREDVRVGSTWERYWNALVDLFRSWFAPAPAQPGAVDGPRSREEQQVQVVLKYIENELEVPHDDTGH